MATQSPFDAKQLIRAFAHRRSVTAVFASEATVTDRLRAVKAKVLLIIQGIASPPKRKSGGSQRHRKPNQDAVERDALLFIQ